jgi:hypothetical protein
MREACAFAFAIAAAGAVWNALKFPAPFCVHASAALDARIVAYQLERGSHPRNGAERVLWM